MIGWKEEVGTRDQRDGGDDNRVDAKRRDRSQKENIPFFAEGDGGTVKFIRDRLK